MFAKLALALTCLILHLFGRSWLKCYQQSLGTRHSCDIQHMMINFVRQPDPVGRELWPTVVGFCFGLTRDHVNWWRSSECVCVCCCYSRCWEQEERTFVYIYITKHIQFIFGVLFEETCFVPVLAVWTWLLLQKLDTGKESLALWLCVCVCVCVCVSLINVPNTPVCL